MTLKPLTKTTFEKNLNKKFIFLIYRILYLVIISVKCISYKITSIWRKEIAEELPLQNLN